MRKRGNEFKTGHKIKCVGSLEGRKDREKCSYSLRRREVIKIKLFSFILLVCMFTCEGQRTTGSTVRVPGVELGSPSLAANAVTYRVTPKVLSANFLSVKTFKKE